MAILNALVSLILYKQEKYQSKNILKKVQKMPE